MTCRDTFIALHITSYFDIKMLEIAVNIKQHNKKTLKLHFCSKTFIFNEK